MKADLLNPLLIQNLEGNRDFDVRWPREHRDLPPGLTAVLRVKNEARSMPWVLPPLFRAVQQVILVDNGSDDGTADVARAAAEAAGRATSLSVLEYPFDVSRCGPEHLNTPQRSLHSLPYFYNWSFSHVRTAYSMKWDGDMVLTEEGIDTFADLAWQLQTTEAVVSMPRHPLFVESDRVAYLDRGLRNIEEYVSPMGSEYRHGKAYEWELRLYPLDVVRMTLPEGLCVELKHLDEDEFSHWSDTEGFDLSARTRRKQREVEVFDALLRGEPESVPAIERIEAPPGVHVIDYVTQELLPRIQRPVADPAALEGTMGAEADACRV